MPIVFSTPKSMNKFRYKQKIKYFYKEFEKMDRFFSYTSTVVMTKIWKKVLDPDQQYWSFLCILTAPALSPMFPDLKYQEVYITKG